MSAPVEVLEMFVESLAKESPERVDRAKVTQLVGEMIRPVLVWLH